MSFLAPWFLAAAAAISLPIIFHLVRRTPQGQQTFSSLMFLSPSPPRLTRRSRLDQWLLLLLRALALLLLAAAFARPFLRQENQLDLSNVVARRTIVLVDASASMRRGDLWPRAVKEAEQVVGEASPTDRLAVFTFDAAARPVIGFAELADGPDRRAALVKGALAKAKPSWSATDLGGALATAADALHAAHDQDQNARASRQIILISDLQEGASLDALRSYDWPQEVRVDVRRLAPPPATNAGLHLATERLQSLDGETAAQLRVYNDRDSALESFRLAWRASSNAEQPNKPLDIYVPPGQSRVKPMEFSGALAAGAWTLAGDDFTFDNTLHVAPRRPVEMTVKLLGDDAENDPDGLRYYLERALVDTPLRQVKVQAAPPDGPIVEADFSSAELIVVGQAPSPQNAKRLRKLIQAGATVLYVVDGGQSQAALRTLLDAPALIISEAEVDDYAMLGQLDFQHPLFAAMSQPQYSDFTKIRFWRHRVVEVPDAAKASVVARFDDGEPALRDVPLGEGRLLILATSWRPQDSQLALSTKFVPILESLLAMSGGAAPTAPQHSVGQKAPLPKQLTSAGKVRVVRPTGEEVLLASDATTFDETDEPGLYRAIGAGGEEHLFAINVPPSESRVSAADGDALEQRGVSLGVHASAEEQIDRLRQMRDVELESRQKVWRWLLVAALVVLVVETIVAGRKSPVRQG